MQGLLQGKRVMTSLSVRFSQALARGRHARVPDSRATLLATLLRKRATAHAVGAEELEALLRDQIRWSLPIERLGTQPDGTSAE